MIPLRDDNPTRTFPFVTIALIVLNGLVFVFELSLGPQIEAAVRRYGVIPYTITHCTDWSVLKTLVTSLFFHGSLMHIAGNMLYLWIFGNNIEDRLGHFRFVIFYLLCGVAATFGHILFAWNSQVPTIGASGAISGVLGAYLVLFPNARILTLLPLLFIMRIVTIDARWFLLFWIFYQILNGSISFSMAQQAGSAGGVAWFAHIAGFFAGILLLSVFLPKRRMRRG